MAGKAILTCRPNSHPFQERTLTLEQPVKIGRSVARARSAPNNAIFDCKVLSRNHALFWYTNGKFYLQDTKSSNGTFVNNQRLSKSGEESAPREVCSGDIVQFGVDVLENTRKVTHGCIVANLKLYLPDGKEAKASHSSSVMASPGSLPVEDLYQLNQYIQEAIQREQMLENKLFTLQSVLDNIRQATDQGWKALIAEDRLLSRVEILENQLQTYSKSFAEDKLREELRKLQEDKSQYQTTAKDFLKKVLEEKLDAVQKCQEVKRSLVNVEAEYSTLCEQMAKSHRDIQELAQKLSSQLAKNDEMEAKLQEIEDQHKETVERLEARNLELEHMLEKQHATEASLERQVSELEVAGHLAKKRASAYELQLKALNNVPITGEADSYFEKSEENLEVCNKDEEHERINHRLEEHMKNKEVFELFTAQLSLLQGEKRSRLHPTDKLEDDWEGYSKKRLDGEKKMDEDEEEEVEEEEEDEEEEGEARSKKLEPGRDEDKGSNATIDSVQFEEMNVEEDNVANSENENIDPMKSQKEELKYANHESKLILERSNELIVDIDQGKDIINKTCDSCLVGEKLQIQKGQQVIEEWQTQTLTEVNPILNDPIKQQGNLTNSSSFNDEEKYRLKNQLIEAQQIAKQSRNEAAQMADRIKSLMGELESMNRNQDNKTKDELERKKNECGHLQITISSLQSQIASLKEECIRLQADKELLESPKTGALEVNSNLSETSLQLKELQLKVQHLEEELVIVGTKYMNCNEERTKLNRELHSLRLDYQAVTHQPYFNLIFALPCIVLFVAIITAFYPTLSRLTGTSDHTHPSE